MGRRTGFSLIELVIFLTVASVATVGVLLMFQVAMSRSSDGVAVLQSREAALSLLEEVLSMPMTYCDLSDPSVSSAASPAACSIAQGLTPLAGKARGSLVSPFNNVGDYGGYVNAAVVDVNGNPFPGLTGFQEAVALRNVSVGGVPSSEIIEVKVTVSGNGSSAVVYGYRLRHSPNATP